MRKTKNYMKIGILAFGILLTLTNCEKDDNNVSLEQEAQINSKYKVPSVFDTQSKFETLKAQNNLFSNSNYSNNASSKGVSSKENSVNVYIDWEDSKSVNFKTQENINILYTPILFNNSRRMKSFLASIEFEGNIETRAFTLLYDDSSNETQFSGYIFKHNLDGDLLNVYKYTNSIKQEYSFGSQEKTKSLGDALYTEAPNSDCDGASIEDFLWMLEVGYGANELNCVEIAGGGGGDTGSDTNWDNPYDYLNGLSTSGNFSTGGGGSGSSGSGSTGTSGTSNTGDSTSNDTWWAEEVPEAIEANSLTSNLDGLSIAQVKWINNTNNLPTVILLNNFLIANGNTTEAKSLSLEILEALMLDIPVIFDIENSNVFKGNPLNFNILTSEQKVAVVVYAIKNAVNDNAVDYFDIHELFYNLPTVDVDVVAKIPIGGKLLDVRITFGVYNNLQINDFPNNGRQLSVAGMIGNYNITGFWWTLYFRSYNAANNYSADAIWVSVKQEGEYDFENGYYFESYLGY